MTSHLASRRGWAFALLAFVSVFTHPVWAAAGDCNSSSPNARVDPDNQTVPERTGGNFTVVTLDGSKSTPNKDLAYQWTYLGSTPSGLSVTLGSPTAAIATFTSPNVPATGAALNFQLTVRCGTVTNSITTVVNVTDVFVNAPPTPSFFISPLNAVEGDTVTLDGTASSDPDGQPLTYTWSQVGGSPTVTLVNGNGNGSIKTFVAPNLNATTTLTFRLNVSDGTLSNSTDKSVNILYTNDPPVAALTCPAGGVLERNEGQSTTFSAAASTDPEGGPLTYAWSQNMGLPNLGIGGFTTSSITFTAPHLGYNQLGGMTVTVTVTDNQSASVSKSCGLFIKDVTAPVIVVPNDITAEATSAAGANVPYSVTSQDAVEDLLPNPLACVPPSNSLFALDAHTQVNCTDQDVAGNVANANFKIFVDDKTPPILTVPGDTAVDAVDANGAIGNFTATKTDIVDGTAPATCTPATGSQFPLGDTTVNCTAVDAHLNAAAPQSFVLSVMDKAAPTIDPHGDEGPIEATSSAGAIATYTAPATHDAVDGPGVATCVPPSGSTFALGETSVQCDASDAAGNDAAPTFFKVKVVDTTRPVIAHHNDVGPEEATSSAGAAVNYTSPATSDAVDGPGTASCLPASGATFALGTTTVHCNKTDAAGNHADETTFTVLVVDTTPPSIEVHANIEDFEATGPGGAVVGYTPPNWHDLVDGTGSATCAPASGTTFALGTTLVTCNAEDAAHNHAVATTFTIEVVDTTPPVIDPMDDIEDFEATGPGGAAVTYIAPSWHDIVSGAGTATCTPASGTTFALGTTTVTCTAKDGANNPAVPVTFTIEVVDTTPPTIAPHGNIEDFEATGPLGANVPYDAPATSDLVDGPGFATCAPASGTKFALGTTTVTCNAQDAAHNHAVATTFTIEVVDSTPPVIEPHGDINDFEATGPLGASVNYLSPDTHDVVDGDGVATCTPASGSTFGLGPNLVACNAEDAAHNHAVATTFVIEVIDSTPPAIDPVFNILGVEATGPGGAPVSFASPGTHDLVDGNGTATCSPLSGTTFALGSTTVTCSATDNAGNGASRSFSVQVVDTTAPVIDAHGAVGPIEATSAAGAVVNYTRPNSHDAVDGTKPAVCTPAPAATFALGMTTVGCTASDAAGNTATPTSFGVTVVDSTAPVIAGHGNVTMEATSAAGAIVGYASPSTSDAVDGNGTATCAQASGTQFALGTTTVTCNASDNAGNAATPTTFKVFVVDTTAPALQPHADVNVIAPGNSSALVTYTSPTATDAVDATPTVSCTLPSGSTFPMGSTTVTCTATDDAGNGSTSTFHVNVSYAFGGFFRPIDNVPVVNVVKAGQSIPVKFSLGGNQGLAIFWTGYPKAVAMSCTGALQDVIEETVTAGSSTLQYDAGAGQYIYVWKTDKAWAGTCRQLQVKFADGSMQVANFNFTR